MKRLIAFLWSQAFSRPSKVASKLATTLLLVLGVLALAGCQSAEPKVEPLLARFYLEAAPSEASIVAELPVSKTRIAVGPKPVFTEYDIANVEFTKTSAGWCFAFALTPAATKDLYRMSVQGRGRRLVLTLNNTPVGAGRLDQPITNGALLVFVELANDDLPPMADRIRRTSAGLQGGAGK